MNVDNDDDAIKQALEDYQHELIMHDPFLGMSPKESEFEMNEWHTVHHTDDLGRHYCPTGFVMRKCAAPEYIEFDDAANHPEVPVCRKPWGEK